MGAEKVNVISFCPSCGASLDEDEHLVLAGSDSESNAEIRRLREALATEKQKHQDYVRAMSAAAMTHRPKVPELPKVSRSGAKLNATRERLGLSQIQLGDRLGLARSSVANYENGLAPLSKKVRAWMERNS